MNKSDLPIRINKYLSEIGFCSRREADKLIKEGRVFVNGKLIEMDLKITLNDRIEVDGELMVNQNY